MILIKAWEYEYEVKIIDGTHLKMRMIDDEKWGIPWHFAQLDKSIITQLDKQGYVNEWKNFFINY
jgi:hypothetical protein